MKNIAYLCLLILTAQACTSSHFYNEYKSVDTKNWKSTDTLTFDVEIEDIQANYNILVSVRHQKTYEFSNLWLTYFLENQPAKIEVPLFKLDGKPYGESSGSLCTQTIPLKSNFHFPKKGKNIIKVVHLMRKDPLDGVSDIGIIIDKK
ncbi:MAG: gliding motility lipoprotein GldH [Chitinophagales bacterium]|nr:gliding motility lipoprotein GldH [Bacteroidota bacterium]